MLNGITITTPISLFSFRKYSAVEVESPHFTEWYRYVVYDDYIAVFFDVGLGVNILEVDNAKFPKVVSQINDFIKKGYRCRVFPK